MKDLKKSFKALLLILFLGIAAPAALSQTHYKPIICVGGKIGADISYVMFNPAVKQNWPVNPTLGARIRYVEENHFGLVGELNYVRRGWAENFEGLPFHYHRNIDYIDIPILAHIYFGKRSKFFVNLGPEISFKLASSISSNFNPEEIASIPDFPLRNRRNEQLTEKVSQKVDFGISAGIGVEHFITPQHGVDFEARYYFGLGNILPSSHQDNFRASNMMTIAFTLGYWFRMK